LNNSEINWTSYNGTYNYATEKNIPITVNSSSSAETVERMDFSTGYIELELNDVIRFE
jgi:hypothetical protein